MRTALAVIVAGSLGAPAAAQEIGRLFHSVEQRSALDGFRKSKSLQPNAPRAEPAAPSPPARIDGYVVRSDGTSTVWVDGRSIAGPAAAGGLIGEGQIKVRR